MRTWSRVRGVLRDPGGLFGALVIALILIAAIAGPALAPYDPSAQSLETRHLPPFWMDGGSTAHLLGTDQLGRDLASRVIQGARVSTIVGVAAVLMQVLVGVTLGLLAGYWRGALDAVIMRLADVWLAVPFLVLAMALAVVLGPGLWSTVLVLGAVGWVTFARIVRAQTLSIRERDFVLASRVAGARPIRTMRAEILPNVAASVIVVATLQVSQMIIAEAALSFLGLGIQPPDVGWGSMIAEGRDSLSSAWWVAAVPGAALVIATLGINLFGDALRDELDPRIR
ncbi:ABC transporter permease [Nonomuraea sp. MG754425]|uniref:ABC transporter permease n=1 Tax=Nonomuraea sp. MG754425 TaxID=2570319 RepID=UPI001F1D2E48|nr:ABC transporter permease [Nonomuraea sp. MG754425]MCF6467848.1 ABC transporter permease [Nonomuraea sp. MG754425]